MVAVIYSILWILAALKWGDWQNGKRYYPTALFAVIGNLLYEVVCSEYPMWMMEPNGLPNHTLPILLLSIVGMPISVFIYLSHFPFEKPKGIQLLYILIFVALFTILELISVHLGAITYHNGWNIYWSILFDLIMFIILRIHYNRPKISLVLSIGVILTLSFIFGVTFEKMK